MAGDLGEGYVAYVNSNNAEGVEQFVQRLINDGLITSAEPLNDAKTHWVLVLGTWHQEDALRKYVVILRIFEELAALGVDLSLELDKTS